MPRNYNRDIEMKRSDRMYKKSYDENMKQDGFKNRSGLRKDNNGRQFYYGSTGDFSVTRDAYAPNIDEASKATRMLRDTKNMTRDNISKNRTRMRKQTASKKK